METPQPETALDSLRRRWRLLAAADLALVLAGSLALRALWGAPEAAAWAAGAAALLAYQLAFLWPRLRLNTRAAGGDLLPTLGPGNALTLARGQLIALLGGFLLLARPPGLLAWAPAALYTLADLADYFDGYLARRAGHATRLGEALDVEFDALGLLLAISLAVRYGALTAWFLPIGLARYAFLAMLWLLPRLGRAPRPLPPSRSRRPIAGLTMGFTTAVLWPIVAPPASTLAGAIFALPFAASFTRDGLVVAGLLDPDSHTYRIWRARLRAILLHWLPPLVRLAALTVSAAPLARAGLGLQALISGGPFEHWGIPFAWTEFACLLLILLGAAGRLAAFVRLFPLGLSIAWGAADVERLAALGLTLAILILGTGAVSPWKPEERWFGRRAGESA